MYFLWRNTTYGPIKISHEGLSDFANYILKSGFRLYSITLAPSQEIKQRADLTIVISDENLPQDVKNKIASHLAEVLAPTGMNASVVWAEPERGVLPLVKSPFTWAFIAAGVAVIITAGFSGFFWTAFWGTAAWFVIKGLAVVIKIINK